MIGSFSLEEGFDESLEAIVPLEEISELEEESFFEEQDNKLREKRLPKTKMTRFLIFIKVYYR